MCKFGWFPPELPGGLAGLPTLPALLPALAAAPPHRHAGTKVRPVRRLAHLGLSEPGRRAGGDQCHPGEC